MFVRILDFHGGWWVLVWFGGGLRLGLGAWTSMSTFHHSPCTDFGVSQFSLH